MTAGNSKQWSAEFNYTIPRSAQSAEAGIAGRTYRVVVKRHQVDVSEGQEYLFTEYRDQFVITDIPRSHMDPAEVFCFAYGRCDQENIIEQLKNGIAAKITHGGRRAQVSLSGSHRFVKHLVIASQRLHTFAFQ